LSYCHDYWNILWHWNNISICCALTWSRKNQNAVLNQKFKWLSDFFSEKVGKGFVKSLVPVIFNQVRKSSNLKMIHLRSYIKIYRKILLRLLHSFRFIIIFVVLCDTYTFKFYNITCQNATRITKQREAHCLSNIN